MNFKDSYKKDNENIKPSEELINKLRGEIKEYKLATKSDKRKINYKVPASIVAALIAFTVLIFGGEKLKQNMEPDIIGSNQNLNNDHNEEDEINKEDKDGVYVPKMQLGKIDSNVMASRIPTLVYKGRVYTDMGTQISLEEGKALLDKKIGVTWCLMDKAIDDGTIGGYIDLESLEDFACIGEGDEVYTARGYQDDFRLLTYTKNEYGEFITLWECLNDFILGDGSDLFGKMKIKDNLQSVTWETFNNWNYGTFEGKEVVIDDTLNSFIEALYSSIPYSLENEEFRKELFDKESNYSTGEDYDVANEERQKFMFLKMKDGTEVQIRLFKEGYVYYSGLNFAFKLEENTFNNMWNYLQ